ncbi:MAG: DUF5060 domain-containing protein [Candidatus Poribacteria bacterium]
MERKHFSIWLIMAHSFALMCFVTGVVLIVHGTAQETAEGGEDMVERWGIFEIELKGPDAGNPFLDVELSAQFKHGAHTVEVDGFYDGDGIYKIRFMPDELGKWGYTTESNRPELDNKTGEFNCVKPSSRNHGPVGIHNTYYFNYADGTPYFQIGTTSYTWVHQEEKLQKQTLEKDCGNGGGVPCAGDTSQS